MTTTTTEHNEEHTGGEGIKPPPAESLPGDALRCYDIAVANAETIGSSGWSTLAIDERDHVVASAQRQA